MISLQCFSPKRISGHLVVQEEVKDEPRCVGVVDKLSFGASAGARMLILGDSS
jgi:hypothetical protein